MELKRFELVKKTAFEDAVTQYLTAGSYVPVGDFGTDFRIEERWQVGKDGQRYWRWEGTLPKDVLSTDTPSSPDWTDVTQATLAADLINPAESGNRVARMAITADSLVNFLDVPFIDGRTYSNNGFYPGATVGGGQWKAVSGADLTQNNGGTFVSKAALQAWYDAAVAAGGVTTANLQANLSTLFAAGTGTGDGFVRIYGWPTARIEIDPFIFGALAKEDLDSSAFSQLSSVSKNLKANIVCAGGYTFFNDAIIEVSDGSTFDFCGSKILSPNQYNQDMILITGSNTTVKNVTVEQKDANYDASSGSAIALKGAKNFSNVSIVSVKTHGFSDGIKIIPDDGFVASAVKISNSITSYSNFAGVELYNCNDVEVVAHTSTYNARDGLKTTKLVSNLSITGGFYSFNRHPTEDYADGIDLYAGGSSVTMSGAICSNNGGVGIHILSASLNDPSITSPVNASIANIAVSSCITNNNDIAGFDVVTQSPILTYPYPAKVNFNGCISNENGLGCNITARYVTLSGCSFARNLDHGARIFDSIFITIDSCNFIANGKSLPGSFAGIRISNSENIEINGGFINGADSDTLQKEDGSSLTVYHFYPIWIDNSDDIYINVKNIKNYTGTRQVFYLNYFEAANDNKRIVVNLGDIGSDNVNQTNGFKGSSIYKDGDWYVKKTGLNSTVWELQS